MNTPTSRSLILILLFLSAGLAAQSVEREVPYLTEDELKSGDYLHRLDPVERPPVPPPAYAPLDVLLDVYPLVDWRLPRLRGYNYTPRREAPVALPHQRPRHPFSTPFRRR